MNDCASLVDEAFNIAKERWGDVPVSAKILYHEDGVSGLLVFHTVYSDDARVGRVELLWNRHFHQEHFIVSIPDDTAHVDHVDIDETVPRLRDREYWIGDDNNGVDR